MRPVATVFSNYIWKSGETVSIFHGARVGARAALAHPRFAPLHSETPSGALETPDMWSCYSDVLYLVAVLMVLV